MLSLLVAMLLTGATRLPSGLIGSGMDGWIGVHDRKASRSLPWTSWVWVEHNRRYREGRYALAVYRMRPLASSRQQLCRCSFKKVAVSPASALQTCKHSRTQSTMLSHSTHRQGPSSRTRQSRHGRGRQITGWWSSPASGARQL